MSGTGDGAIATPLRTLFGSGAAAGASDAELLERFAGRGPGAEAAFSTLIDRHGPMVLAVCRRQAGDPSSAEDAFQATWLALVRRSGSIRLRGSLAPWLFAVARRVALRARRRADRQRPSGVNAPEPIDPRSPAEDAERADLARAVLDEVARLPDRYRAPVLLCHVERRSHDEAARALGWPVGTVRGRLHRARRLLRDRLERRGIGLSVAAALDGLRREATAAVPAALEAAVIRFVSVPTSGALAAQAVPAAVSSLVQETFLMTFPKLIQAAIAGTMVGGLVIGGGIGLAARAPTPADGESPPQSSPAVPEVAAQPTQVPVAGVESGGEHSAPDAGPTPTGFEVVVDDVAVRDDDVLGRTVTIEPGRTMAEAFQEIEAQALVPIRFDWRALASLAPEGPFVEEGSWMEQDSWLTGREMNLGKALGMLLAPLELDFVVDRDAIVIVPEDELRHKDTEELREELRRARGVIGSLKRRAEAGAESPDGPPSQNEPLAPAEEPGAMPASEGATPAIRGGDRTAEEPVDPAGDSFASVIEPTVAEVARLFAEKAAEAIEIESALAAWERLGTVDEAGKGTPEVDQFVNRTRTLLEARLEQFAGKVEDAPEAFERLKADLTRLIDLQTALMGPEGHAAEWLATAVVQRNIPRDEAGFPIEQTFVTPSYLPTAERVRSLFQMLGVELGEPSIVNGQLGFAPIGGGMSGMMGGMGGGMGGGYR